MDARRAPEVEQKASNLVASCFPMSPSEESNDRAANGPGRRWRAGMARCVGLLGQRHSEHLYRSARPARRQCSKASGLCLAGVLTVSATPSRQGFATSERLRCWTGRRPRVRVRRRRRAGQALAVAAPTDPPALAVVMRPRYPARPSFPFPRKCLCELPRDSVWSYRKTK